MAKVKVGGLFWCCVETAENTEGTEGEIITCPHCADQMIMLDGAWEWYSEDLAKKDAESKGGGPL